MRNVFGIKILPAQLCLFLAMLLSLGVAQASSSPPSGLVYQGRIIKPDGSPEEGSSVQFSLRILSSGPEACILWDETQTLNMTGTSGVFELVIGNGTAGSSMPSPQLTFEQIFDNTTVKSGLTCSSGTSYTPAAGATRLVEVQFNDGSGWVSVTPSYTVYSTPYAEVAANADTLGGIGSSGYVQTVDSNTQSRVANLTTTTNYNAIMAMIGGTNVAGQNANLAGLANGDTLVWNSTSNEWTAGAGGGGGSGTVTSVSGTSPITVTNGTSTANVSMTQSSSSASGYLSSSDWSTFNSKMSSSLTSGDIWVGNGSGTATAVAPGGDVTMTNAGAFTVAKVEGTAVSATAPTTAGQVLKYDGSSSWVPNFINIGDIRSTVTGNAQFFPTTCTSSQTMTYSSVTDTFSCADISVAASNFGSQTQATFLAAPATASGTPTFRSIASTDLPAGGYDSTYFKNGGNSFTGTANVGTANNYGLNIETDGSTRMMFDTSGNVEIGSVSPRATLDVAGTAVGKAETLNSTSTIDFSKGNVQYTTNSCGAFQFNNMKDGGTYTFIVKGTTSATCSFTAYSDAGVTALTVHMPPDNAATISGKQTMFNLIVGGTDLYVAWTPGY